MGAPESGNVYYTIFGNIERETEKAYLWKLADSTMRPFWMPKSQCKNFALVPNDDGQYSIEVKEWILNDKGVPENDRYSHDEIKQQDVIGELADENREFDLDAPPWDDDAPAF